MGQRYTPGLGGSPGQGAERLCRRHVPPVPSVGAEPFSVAPLSARPPPCGCPVTSARAGRGAVVRGERPGAEARRHRDAGGRRRALPHHSADRAAAEVLQPPHPAGATGPGEPRTQARLPLPASPLCSRRCVPAPRGPGASRRPSPLARSLSIIPPCGAGGFRRQSAGCFLPISPAPIVSGFGL